MKYKLTVIKYEDNISYEKDMAEWKTKTEGYQYRGMDVVPQPDKETAERSLEVFLSDEEYEKVKQEVIKIFK
ncbi:MAG: hypothetical protein WCT36_06075 [Candidatus Gracilibacteria bacterium]|jgi:hypothetical protein